MVFTQSLGFTMAVTLQPLILSRVQLIIGKTGEVLSLTQAVHLAIFTLSELNQLSLGVPFLEQRKSAPSEQEAGGDAFSFCPDALPVHLWSFVPWAWEKHTSFSQWRCSELGRPTGGSHASPDRRGPDSQSFCLWSYTPVVGEKDRLF